ncbi:MAG: hypothetical protein ACYCSF_12205 [Acidimicrobiales bacterium]
MGYLGDQQVSAEWRDGYLVADEELMAVADGLVKLGTEFGGGDMPAVRAGLDDPVAIVLTLARSFDRITRASVELDVGENERIETVIRGFGSSE